MGYIYVTYYVFPQRITLSLVDKNDKEAKVSSQILRVVVYVLHKGNQAKRQVGFAIQPVHVPNMLGDLELSQPIRVPFCNSAKGDVIF